MRVSKVTYENLIPLVNVVCTPPRLLAISYQVIIYRCITLFKRPYTSIHAYTIPYHTIPDHTIPYHTIPYHTVPYTSAYQQIVHHYTTIYHQINRGLTNNVGGVHLSLTQKRPV
ncbi:hypothetical protein HanRHA438_Chr12g0571641 [Helianthus annuus]|nr:hypothetical protein HanRHA438_Chr12g0571641 [Helianthus annuus]